MRPMWAIAAAGGLAWGGWSVWNSALAAEGDAPKPAAKQAGEAKQPATKAEPKPAPALPLLLQEVTKTVLVEACTMA